MEEWKFTINTQHPDWMWPADLKNFRGRAGLPLSPWSFDFEENEESPSVHVDWGDGVKAVLDAYSPQEDFEHDYHDGKDVHQITLASDAWDKITLTAIQLPLPWKIRAPEELRPRMLWENELISVDSPLPKVLGVVRLEVMSETSIHPIYNPGSLECCFQGCDYLRSVSSDIFSKNPDARSFENTFAVSGLVTVPGGIFDRNTNAQNFTGVFADCRDLRSVSGGIFDKNQEAYCFNEIFYGCENLHDMPDGLFAKTSWGTDIERAFFECHALNGIPKIFSKDDNEIHRIKENFQLEDLVAIIRNLSREQKELRCEVNKLTHERDELRLELDKHTRVPGNTFDKPPRLRTRRNKSASKDDDYSL